MKPYYHYWHQYLFMHNLAHVLPHSQSLMQPTMTSWHSHCLKSWFWTQILVTWLSFIILQTRVLFFETDLPISIIHFYTGTVWILIASIFKTHFVIFRNSGCLIICMCINSTGLIYIKITWQLTHISTIFCSFNIKCFNNMFLLWTHFLHKSVTLYSPVFQMLHEPYW